MKAEMRRPRTHTQTHTHTRARARAHTHTHTHTRTRTHTQSPLNRQPGTPVNQQEDVTPLSPQLSPSFPTCPTHPPPSVFKEETERQRSQCLCLFVGWLVGCFTSQQQASVSQGRICSDNFTCCHTEIEVADQTFCLTQSQYTDTGPTSPSADPRTPGAWQGSHWSANI